MAVLASNIPAPPLEWSQQNAMVFTVNYTEGDPDSYAVYLDPRNQYAPIVSLLSEVVKAMNAACTNLTMTMTYSSNMNRVFVQPGSASPLKTVSSVTFTLSPYSLWVPIGFFSTDAGIGATVNVATTGYMMQYGVNLTYDRETTFVLCQELASDQFIVSGAPSSVVFIAPLINPVLFQNNQQVTNPTWMEFTPPRTVQTMHFELVDRLYRPAEQSLDWSLTIAVDCD